MPETSIRRIDPGEYAAAGDLVVQAYRSLGDAGDAFYEAQLRDVAGRVEAGGVVLVAESGGVIEGCVTVSFGSTALSEVDDPDAATIRMLGVSTAVRGRGIGEALVRRCIDEAHANGSRRVRLDPRTSSTSAQRWYGRLGFTRDPQHD